jgi:hypothetical protein
MGVDESTFVARLNACSENVRGREDFLQENREGNMADKMRDQNQQKDQGKQKAMGAVATGGAQGQQGKQGQQNLDRNPQSSESAGQGGGIQGTGQRQPSQGLSDKGFQGGSQRDEFSRQRGQVERGGLDDDDF